MNLNPAFGRLFLFLIVISFCFFSHRSFCQQNNSRQKPVSSDNIFHTLRTRSCTGSLGDPIINFTFGSGSNPGPPLKDGTTTLQYLANACPNDGYYTIANYTSGCFNNSWYTITDHTGDANGYFMLVNASYQPSDFYVQKVDGLCSGTTYQFSAWILNIHNSLTGIAPNITFSIESTSGAVLQSYNSGDIVPATSPIWKQYGLFFTTPAGVNSVVIRMKNNAPGGIGNDLALDDISFRPAGPLTTVTSSTQTDSINVCTSSVQLNSNIETCYLSNEYQWQVNVNGNWTNIPGATSQSYTVPVQPAGKYRYRLLVSQAGNININSCRVNSNTITVIVVPAAIIKDTSAIICSGQSYTLPSGKTVKTAGLYNDTVRYAFGCDSLITDLRLTVQSPTVIPTNVTICEGETYTLPWGVAVNTAGVYHDTLKYRSGCDSIIFVTNLTVKPVIIQNTWINSCQGQSVTLPWGAVVSGPGIYSDTTKYNGGCDSLIRNVQLHVTIPVLETIERSVCPGQSYTLPSGAKVNIPGTYHDTLRTAIGCDSIITFITLSTSPPPAIHISKSNDVTCSLGISKLKAAGGQYYLWSPAETLDNASVFNPVASPAVTTVYHVQVTTPLGCTGEDSIMVNVSADASMYGIYIPNAFTPNNDGLNDCFGVKYLGQMKHLKFSIYNRWGNRLFYTTNPSQCWDGSYNGQKLKSDVFIYQISATTLCGEIFKKGTVMLIR